MNHPHLQRRLSSAFVDDVLFTEPLSTYSLAHQASLNNNDLLRTYAQAVIISLRTELESERQAHEQTRERAEFDILSLNARLANREAELEAHIAYLGHKDPQVQAGSTSSHAAGSGHPETDKLPAAFRRSVSAPISQQDAINILEISAARNRSLEAEVRGLIGRVSEIIAFGPAFFLIFLCFGSDRQLGHDVSYGTITAGACTIRSKCASVP